jgi:asparagine synthase (glutamine-hydrolysing)
MCGIAGYVGVPPETGRTTLSRMAQQMVHRGPDGEGIVAQDGFGLAHRRLAVIDRAGGTQPMRSADGRWLLVYNGEVYNYRELRAELIELGHTFTTRSDTEVVLAAWVQWGAGAFDRFNGMFALALADTVTGQVVLARDQFGIKPLYLAADGSGRVAFASEIRALLAAAIVPRRPDDVSIYRYLRFRIHDDTERTFFEGIRRVRPGQVVRIAPDGTVRRQEYTRLRYELDWLAAAPRRYDATAGRQVEAELTAAVRRRLVSDVPVGTALSGGLDSSTVVAIINRLLGERDPETGAVGAVQRSFSAVFPGQRNDEERYVDAVAAACRQPLEVHKVHPDADEFLEDLVDFVRTQEEPVISTGPYAQYCVMRRAAGRVTVMLDGQGADEMMAGYLPYFVVHLRQLVRQRRLLRSAAELVGSAGVLWRLVRFRVADALRGRRPVRPERLMAPDFVAAHPDQRLDPVADDLKRRLVDDIFRVSLPALLRYEDRNTMRFSIEGRVPFLDPQLLKLLWGLDSSAIIRRGWNKRALRHATRQLLPPVVRRRRDKIGFTTPEEAWFDRVKSFVYEVLSSESFGSRPYVDQRAVTAAFHAYLSGRTSAETMLFWRLVNLELWLREFIDNDPTVPLATAAGAGPQPRTARHHGRPGMHEPAPPKPDWVANPDKVLLTPDRRWARYPLWMDLVRAGDDVPSLAAVRAARFFTDVSDAPAAAAPADGSRWYLFCSEKMVAVAQGRSYFTWEIRPSWWARRLSRYVTRTPYGIGLGDPTTMHLAIGEVGLLRILAASAVSAAGKAVGKRGLFYRVAGARVAAIDGPTQYSAYPSNVSAKLAPADPVGVARQVSAAVRATVPADVADRYGGAAVIDANDLGCTVLGHDTDRTGADLVAAFADNPLGQGREQTPLAVVCALAPATAGRPGEALAGRSSGGPAGRSSGGPAGQPSGGPAGQPSGGPAGSATEQFAAYQVEHVVDLPHAEQDRQPEVRAGHSHPTGDQLDQRLDLGRRAAAGQQQQHQQAGQGGPCRRHRDPAQAGPDPAQVERAEPAAQQPGGHDGSRQVGDPVAEHHPGGHE